MGQMRNLCDLDEDSLGEILKYLTFKERVKFSRVDKRWARVFGSLWLSQKKFSHIEGSPLSDSSGSLGLWTQSDYQIGENDGFAGGRSRFGMTFGEDLDPVSKILARTSNLRVLQLMGVELSSGPEFRDIFAKLLPSLELLAFRESSPVRELLSLVDGLHQIDLKCLSLGLFNCEEDEDQDQDEDIFRFLSICTKLETLEADALSNRVLELVLPQLKQLRLQSLDAKNMDAIRVSGHRLERICLSNDDLSGAIVEEICSALPFLKALEVKSCFTKNAKYLRKLKHLRHIDWSDYCCTAGENDVEMEDKVASALLNLFAAIGKQLKSICIFLRISCESTFRSVPELCPHLQKFDINCSFNRRTDVAIDCMSRLCDLRTVSLRHGALSLENSTKLLAGCQKLKQIKLIWFKNLHPDYLDPFKAYSKQHPKRTIRIHVHNCYPASTGSERTEVFANLRIYYKSKK